MARLMSWMKINIRLLESPKDKTIAKLMLEGCNMGISQLSEYLNTFTKADSRSREITERLLTTEEELGTLLRKYLRPVAFLLHSGIITARARLHKEALRYEAALQKASV